MSEQPFRMAQKIVVERRFSDGTLDLCREPQPPTFHCRYCGNGSNATTFAKLYTMFFRETKSASIRGSSSSYEELDAWLKSKGWSIRAKTW